MTQSRLYRVSALVIRQRDLGEADRIVTLFSAERGKLSAVARGVKKPRSKLASSLQLFAHARFSLARGRSLDILTHVAPFDFHYRLRTDMNRYSHASYAAELLDAFTEEGAPNPTLFQLLLDTLAGLDREADPATLTSGFQLKVLSLLGHGPELSACVSCGADAPPGRAAFSAPQGGLLCPSCSPSEGGAPLSPLVYRALRDLVSLPQTDLASRRLTPPVSREVSRLIHSFIDYHLDRRLRSAAFISQGSPL